MKEFFVGYIPTIPPGILWIVRRAVAGILLGAALLAIALTGSQRPFPPAFFEFTQERDFEGIVEERPYPALLVARPGITNSEPAYSRYLLVSLGKHGAAEEMAGFAGKQVKLRGKLIYRDSETLVEVMPQTVSIAAEVVTPPTPQTDLGPVTLTGEIVDSKCYFGVMNPGGGKVHRDCATRCLAGGIPPALIVREAGGRATVYILADPAGGPVPADWAARRAAQPITIRGRVVKSGDALILEADLGSAQMEANLARE
jgi:hypothetical protein